MRIVRAMLDAVHRLEDALLAMLLVVMIGLAVVQIVLRNGFDGGILWADSLLRVLVLWIALIGAIVSCRERQHISMDIITRFLTTQGKRWVSVATNLFASGICMALAWYSLDFVMIEKESGTIAFSGVPAWLCQSVMPFAFAVMSLRFLLQAALGLMPVERELSL